MALARLRACLLVVFLDCVCLLACVLLAFRSSLLSTCEHPSIAQACNSAWSSSAMRVKSPSVFRTAKRSGVSHCEEIYGEGEFKIMYREVRTLAQ